MAYLLLPSHRYDAHIFLHPLRICKPNVLAPLSVEASPASALRGYAIKWCEKEYVTNTVPKASFNFGL